MKEMNIKILAEKVPLRNHCRINTKAKSMVKNSQWVPLNLQTQGVG